MTSHITRWAYQCGITDRLVDLRSDVLTVLCYHRIGVPSYDCFRGFRTNFSASPQNFVRQITYLCEHFTPVSALDVSRFVAHGQPLPARSVLITFDDGYTDNGAIAWPILRSQRVPAIVFLVTDHVGTSAPFIWDFAAFCCHQTQKRFAEIPLLGATALETIEARAMAADQWVECSKSLPASERWPAAEAMRRSLEIEVPHTAFSDLYLTWEDVRRLVSEGMEFGGHTKSHPILTTIPADQGRQEIFDSFERIRRELGRPPIAFAYPNGSVRDFDEQHEHAARAAGYSIAFSLIPGPTSLLEVRRKPMAIRRIYVGFQDDMPRFAAKLAGGSRIKAGAQLWPFAQARGTYGESIRQWDSWTWH